MALSPAGFTPLPTSPPATEWDPDQALDVLLAVPGESVTAVDFDFSLTTEEEAAAAGEIYNCGLSPPSLLSPASDVGSTQSVDSGILSAVSSVFPALSQRKADSDSPLSRLDSVNSSSSSSSSSSPTLSKSRRSTRFNSIDIDEEETSPSPPPALPQISVVPSRITNSGKKMPPVGTQDKSRKNAEAARQNRLKKKKYMEDLEKEGSKLRAENVVLKTRCAELQNKNKRLETEMAYLHSVLANQSALATLIQNIPGTPGVNLTSSFSRKRPAENSFVSPLPPSSSKKAKNTHTTGGQQRHSGGVCLHVSKESVSLEFCPQCSLNSAQV